MYEILEKLMNSNKVTLYKLSKDTGIPYSSLSDWKNGKSVPKADKLMKIAEYFNVTVEYLQTGKENQNESIYEAKDLTEKELLVLCRKVSDAPDEDKQMIIDQFKASIDMYLKFKGISKE